MCHADLESLRLEICLIESRVSKTRDSITCNVFLIESRVFETRDSITCINVFLIESRVFETRDSIKQTQPYISGHSLTVAVHYLSLSQLSNPLTQKQSILNSHPYTILTNSHTSHSHSSHCLSHCISLSTISYFR